MVFCYRTSYGLTMCFTGFRRPSWEAAEKDRILGEGIEYAKVRVTNIGRTPVYVEGISLDLGFDWWFRPGRRGVTPLQFIDPDDESTEIDLRSAHRLEPGANITAAFLLWPVADPALFKHRKFRKLVVRGQARAVGRWRVARSPWRRAWRIRNGALSRFKDRNGALSPFKDYEPPPDVRVYRVLWKWSSQDHIGSGPLANYTDIVTLLEKGKGADDLQALLRVRCPEVGANYMLIAWEAHHAFHSLVGHPTWANDAGEPNPDH